MEHRRLSVASPHVLLEFRCGSGALAGLTVLVLNGRIDGTIPTEM
jgi:hypothetical protein